MKLEGREGEITMRGMIGDFQNGVSADDFMDLLADQSGDLTIHLDYDITTGVQCGIPQVHRVVFDPS